MWISAIWTATVFRKYLSAGKFTAPVKCKWRYTALKTTSLTEECYNSTRTTPGNKAVYVRITSPDGYVLTTEAMPTFDFEGERLSYSAMREVDYQNQDLEVGIYYNSTGFAAGTYQIQLYCEGRLIGQTQVVMK